MGVMDDEQLVNRFRETGEIRFSDELVRRHVGTVRNLVFPMVLNHADADEVTQEVFLRVVRNIDRFNRRARFSSWLYRITMNTTYSFLKQRARRPFTGTEEPPERPDPAGDPVGFISARETDARIRSALASLSPKLRSAIVLTAMQSMSVEEAARAEGCPKATMYWRIHHARKILHRELAQETRGTPEAKA